eukprot:UN07225
MKIVLQVLLGEFEHVWEAVVVSHVNRKKRTTTNVRKALACNKKKRGRQSKKVGSKSNKKRKKSK